LKTILRLLSFLTPFLKEIGLSVLTGIITIGTGIGMLGTSAYLIAYAALQPSIAELQVAIVGVRFFGISRSIFRYLERLISHSVNLKILARLRVWFYRGIEPSAPAGLQQMRGGDLLSRVMADLESLENFYVRVVSPVIVAFFITLGMSLFLGGYFIPIGGILFAGMFVNGFLLPFFSILSTRKTGKELVQTRSDLSATMLETFQGLEDLQAAGAQTRWLDKVSTLDHKAGSLQVYYGFLSGVNSGMVLLVTSLTVLGVLIAAIPQVHSGAMSGVSLAVVTLLAMASFEATGTLPQAAQNLTACYKAAKRLFDLVKPATEIQKPDLSFASIRLASRLTVENLSFSYPENQGEALEDFTLTLEKGKRVALIGPSGAGKSSLVNILLRFWEYSSGEIKIDDQEIRSFSNSSIRQLFGVISQSTYLFSESIRENLLLAAPEATDDELLNSLHQAELDSWLCNLPEGLDTWLGEQGVQMSGGERQRLAIARVLLQKTPFVLLDEPTSNLDPLTEQKILTTLMAVFADRGMLLITHRMVSMEKMDCIYFLSGGKIIESGSQGALMQKQGAYARFYSLQKNFLFEDLPA